jgi:uncharacterized membrane protein
VFFATQAALSARLALFVSVALLVLSITICAAFLSWVRRAAADIYSTTRHAISNDDHNPGD